MKDNIGRTLEAPRPLAEFKGLDTLKAKGYKFKVHAWANNVTDNGEQNYHFDVTAPVRLTFDGTMADFLAKLEE